MNPLGSGSNSGGHPQNSLDPTTKSLLEQLHKAQATVAAQQQLLQAQAEQQIRLLQLHAGIQGASSAYNAAEGAGNYHSSTANFPGSRAMELQTAPAAPSSPGRSMPPHVAAPPPQHSAPRAPASRGPSDARPSPNWHAQRAGAPQPSLDPSRGAPSRSNDAGPDHGARDDTADLTVGGDASAALDGPTPPGSRERGLVVSTMDSYGFVRCEKRTQDIFFHFSEVIRPGESAEETASLERPVSNGDSVECHIVRNNKTSKLNAVAVALLPPGSVTLEALLPNVFLGKVTRSVTSRRDKGSITLMGLDPSSPAACSDGPVPPEACKEGLELWFVYKDILKKKDLKDKDKARAIKDVVPQVGDRVRFQLRQSKATGAMRAVMIEWVAAPEIDLSALDGPVEMGVVSVVKETFGFLRCLDRSARLFFHFSALPDPDRRPAVGDVLRFKVVADPRTSKDIAVACESLSPADVTQERVVAERAVGTVVATSGAPAWQAVEDGKVAVKTPGEWSGKHAVYSNWEFGRGGEDGAEGKDTREGKDKDKDPLDTLEEGDEVEMTLVWNDKTGALRATSLRLVKKAPLKEGWERGQVSSLKEKFGFVHSASQPVDLFFHQSFLEPPLTIDKVTVGMDVEYRPGMDNKSGKMAAMQVRRAPKGSGAPTVPSSEVIYGHVFDPALPAKGYNSHPTSGILAYTGRDGLSHKLVYKAANTDQPRAAYRGGDHVAFRIWTDLRGSKAAMAVAERGEIPRAGADKFAGDVRLVRSRVRLVALYDATGIVEVVEHDVSANSKKARKSRKEGPAGTASDGHDGHPALPEGMLEPGHMLMFHISEISRPHGAPPPSPGETYDCNIVTNIRTNEVSARRLAKHSDAPEGFVPPEVPPEMAQAATRPAMRPLFARRMADSSARSDSPGGARDSTGERIALPRPARIAKGPDGTRGFTMGRGKAPSKLVLSALASSFVPASVAPGSRGSMAEAGRESTASEIGGRGDGEGEKKEDGERKEGEKEEGEKAEEKEKGVKEEKEEKVQEGEEDKAE